jgi:predicted Zn finger-like uncharacterized protein
MNVSCPQCNHPYKLDESRIPETGQRMRCPKCACTFRVHKGGEIADVSTSTSVAPPGAARPSVAPKRPERRLRPSGLSEPPSPLGRRIDDADLPAPAGGAELPVPKGGHNIFDEIDLPIPAAAAALPVPKSAPKPAFAGEIPAPDPNDPFGDINLASVPPAREAAPPQRPQYEDPFGDIDLPTPAAAPELPAPKRGDPFGEVDLPTPSGAVDLPTPSGAIDLPTPSGAIDLPTPSGAEFLPKPKYEDPFGDIDLRSSATSVAPPRDQKAAPAPAPAASPATRGEERRGARERVQSSGSTDYGEIDLGGGDSGDKASNEFDEFPISEGEHAGAGSRERDASSGFDLAANPHERIARGAFVDEAPPGDAAAGGKDRKGAKFEGRRRYERQSRRVKVLSLSLLVLLIAGGSALSMTDFGPFGVYLIAELLPNATESKVAQEVAAGVGKRLQDDTVASLDEALRALDVARRDYPDNEDLQLLGVFLYNLRDFRFGHDEAQLRKATQLLGKIDLETSESRFAALARASRDIIATQGKRAADFLAPRPSPSPEELALLAEADLAAADGVKALAAAKRLASREKSARASFLVARALELEGKRAEASKALEQLTTQYARHAGGRLMLASILLEDERAEAPHIQELLQPVLQATAAAPAEKARAFALVGRSQLRSRKMQAAKESFDRAAALVPDDLELLLGRGFLALSGGDPVTATTFFVKARGMNPSNVDAKLGHAEAMFEMNMVGDSKALVAELLPANPGNALAHYLMGRIAVSLKGLEEAEKELKAAITDDKGLIEAYVALSDLYSKTGRDKEAMEILDKAGDEAQGSSIVKLTLADAYAARGDYATAIVALNDALDIDPNDVRTHFRMAQLYRKLGSAADAEQALGEVLSRNPSYPGVDVERGLLLESKGQMADALASYERALKATPNDANAKLRAGAASIALREYEKAEPLLVDAVAELPTSAEANYFMGELYRLTERAIDAVTYLRKAAEIEDANALYHLRLGMAFMALHDMTRAAAEIERARLLDPSLAEAPLRAGEIKLRTGSAKDAIALFDEALQRDPKLAEAYGMIGEACEELADFGQALSYYRRAVSELPEDANLNFKLGVTALQVTGPRSAGGPLSKAIALAEAPGTKPPPWLPEAYYRFGVLQQTEGQRAAAIATYKRYLEVAPEKAIDRAEVLSRLEQLGATP